jgi:hypothetical protein
MISHVPIPREAIDLLEEATARGIYIEYRDEELYTWATEEAMSQAALEEFTQRLTVHREGVATMIVLFGLAERHGIH